MTDIALDRAVKKAFCQVWGVKGWWAFRGRPDPEWMYQKCRAINVYGNLYGLWRYGRVASHESMCFLDLVRRNMQETRRD